MKEKMKAWWESLTEETTVTKRELALGAAVCALAGMVVGIAFAKMATGWSWSLSIMSNNGNDNGNDNGNYNPDGGESACALKDKKKGKKSACKKKKEDKEAACE